MYPPTQSRPAARGTRGRSGRRVFREYEGILPLQGEDDDEGNGSGDSTESDESGDPGEY